MGKKDKAENLSKAQRKALEEREHELAAELAKREKKAAKKAARRAEAIAQLEALIEDKSRPKSERKVAKADLAALLANELEATAVEVGRVDVTGKPTEGSTVGTVGPATSAKTKTATAAAATAAVAGNDETRIAAATAAAAADEASHDETDEAIRARVLRKRERRAELMTEEVRAGIDRGNATEVAAYNAELASLGGGDFLTSTAEVERHLAIVKGIPDAEVLPVEQVAEAVAANAAAVEDFAAGARAQVVEPVETEEGTVYAAGAADNVLITGLDPEVDTTPEQAADDFAAPSDAPKVDFEQNGNGQYKVKRPSDGKVVGYTRVTTYIDCLEDKRALSDWSKRLLLEGVALHDTDGQTTGDEQLAEPVVSRVRQLIHVRDVAIAKARKADKKGKLDVGELATYVNGAWSDFKKALNALASELEELGGRNEKSQKGTDIHALCELYDREGIDAVGDLLTEGKISPADLRDVEAYADAMRRAGIKVVDIERTVVNDELKVAGRLDRTGLVRFPGTQRATRCVVDIKTGRLDFGQGKVAQQLEMYAGAMGYDLDTDERTDLKLSRTKGVVVHLPAGTGECHIYAVDLGLGRKGNALAGQVRAWRNEGKRAIDFGTDLAAVTEATPIAAEVTEEQAA